MPWVTLDDLGDEVAAGVAAHYEQLQAAPPPPLPAEILRQAPTTVRQWAARQDWTG